MARPHALAVAIGGMVEAELAARRFQRGDRIGLLDIHVIGIGQQGEVRRAHLIQQRQPLGHGADLMRLVAVQDLEDDIQAFGRRDLADLPR